MSTITRERVEEFISNPASLVSAEESEILELARIALASLEAEAVAWRHFQLTPTDGGYWILHDYKPNCSGVEPLYTAPPALVSVPDYHETLPCPVMLDPGLRFGKGVPTKTMLGALLRRAEYHAELEAMTPEQRADHDAGMKEFADMLQGGKS